MAMAANPQTVEIDGHRVRLSNLDKVLYPRSGTTKAEVVDYYRHIAPVLLPLLRGRPVTRKRWPDGVGDDATPGAAFFTKALERGTPEWVARVPLEHSSGIKDYPLVDSTATLVWLAQLAALELHVPQWRLDDDGVRQDPDRLVLDLDPGPGVDLAGCAEVAVWARTILDGMSLPTVPVTSGSAGIHLYAPLPPGVTSDAASRLAQELARALEADHPDRVVSRMSKAARGGKVFVDWSQNNGKKTTISPYSLRGRALPTVAAPRTWEELADPALRQLRDHEVLTRVAAGIEPFSTVFASPDSPTGNADPLLARYLDKRHRGRTPEPMPATPTATASSDGTVRFVAQEHHARRFHVDLRLEHDGVLVSWAVPRGIPASTTTNHLAVMTEPHPIEYLTFSGTIPRGQYGAGEMSILDTGTVELEKWRDDEVIFRAHGRVGGPMDGARFALVRTSGEGEKSSWLLHRMKDAAATAPALSPMLATAARPTEAAAAITRWGESAWVEIKWDGIRCLCTWDGSRVSLRSRSGNDLTAAYPELTEIDFGPVPCVVDGEIIALDDEGRASFSRLQSRMNLTAAGEIARQRRATPVRLVAFDLLAVDGRAATSLPLRERHALLTRLCADLRGPLDVGPVFDDLDATLETARAQGLEGVVVKNPASAYQPGVRSDHWLKVKLTRTQDVVIGGIRPGRGDRAGQIGSLLVGIPDDAGTLHYAGRVGTGFTSATLASLGRSLAPLGTDRNPFAGVPGADAADAIWVEPRYVGEVEFAEFTPGGILRHARWRGLRPDRDPAEVRRELPE